MVAPKKRRRATQDATLQSIAQQFQIGLITTAWGKVLKVASSASCKDAIRLMDKYDFDQLGIEESGRCGLVRRERLQGRVPRSSVSVLIEWIPNGTTAIAAETPLIEGLSQLRNASSTLVSDGRSIVGLVHRSDFNKQPVRAYMPMPLTPNFIPQGALRHYLQARVLSPDARAVDSASYPQQPVVYRHQLAPCLFLLVCLSGVPLGFPT